MQIELHTFTDARHCIPPAVRKAGELKSIPLKLSMPRCPASECGKQIKEMSDYLFTLLADDALKHLPQMTFPAFEEFED